MPSKFVFSPEPRGGGGIAGATLFSVLGATLFFVLGAIAATALYPNVDANRRSESAGVSERAVPASTFGAISPQSATLSPRERAEYTGGPIPEPTFAATQPVVGAAEGLAHEGHPASAANGEKPDQTGNMAVRKKNIAIGVEETRTSHTANSLHIGAHKDTGVHGALEINLIGAANLYGATS